MYKRAIKASSFGVGVKLQMILAAQTIPVTTLMRFVIISMLFALFLFDPYCFPVTIRTLKVRARNDKGQYVGDDKSTPDVDEAYETVRVKKKKSK